MTLVLSEKMNAFLVGITPPENATQSAAFERLQEMDFPTTRDEYWKYTRLGKINKANFTIATQTTSELSFSDYIVSENYIVIENGIIRTDLSQYSTDYGVTFVDAPSLSDAAGTDLNENDVFNTLNASLFQQAIQVCIKAKATIETPLQLIYVSNGENVMANNRLAVKVEQSANASVMITNISNGGQNCFNNMVTTADVAENAHLTIHKIQAEENGNLQISTEQVRQATNSTFKINTFSLSGKLIRNNINIAVNGENCETYMNGAVVTDGKQHVDNHTFVDHKVPNCYSNENYKYVLDGHSTGVFNGRVVVQQDAQVINAYQNNGNILLSDYASINSKPELEIYADDVKCSHGSTTGQLDEDALFYLQTRGISKGNARKILVSAFVGEVIEAVENENITNLTEQLLNKIHGWKFD